MNESLKILKLLYYKNLLTRKRQWKIILIGEILIPVGFMMCVWAVRNLSAKPSIRFENSTYYKNVSKEEMVNNLYYTQVNLHFTPNNSFTRTLIRNVVDCLRLDPNNITVYGYETEENLVEHYQNTEVGLVTKHAAVVFNDQYINGSTKHLNYKIRTSNFMLTEQYNIFFLKNMFEYYTSINMFVPLQICLDESFIKMKTKDLLFNSQIFVQRIPYPPHIQQSLTDSIIRQLFTTVMITIFMIPLFIETSNASSEKFAGIHVLMSMNGVSNALNIFSWLSNGIIFITLVCVTPIVVILLYSTGDALPFINYSNPFLIWLALTLHIAHLFSYGIHISAYFSKFLYVIFGILACNICSAVLQLHGLTEDTYVYAPYLGIIFPNMLLNRIIEEFNYYETTGEGIQWNNLYLVGNPAYEFMGSTGMVLLLSVVGIIIHFIIAIYIYAINPGKYGVKKHPLFFLQYRKKTSVENYVKNLEYNNLNKKPFEAVSGQAYMPGIQIRNLKKSYNIGLFKNKQFHALCDVSIDFYKGQITTLLGHNGAGKTTLMSILTGMTNPTDGLIIINSKNMREYATEIMNDIGLCPQENILFPNLSVKEQLLFFTMLKSNEKSKGEIEQNLKSFLKKLKLYDKRNSLPKELSGGQTRRVCLGLASITDSSILILDEPTSGLDPESRRIIWDILLKMRGEKTILISTHDMEEADILGDRIAIMHTGQLKAYGTSMYLKKLLGQDNIQVSLSVEPWCDIEKLCDKLNCKDKNNKDGNRIIMNIPNSPNLPDWLDNLENCKNEYGISGLSISLITLEQVFLKVTKENDDPITPLKPLNRIGQKVTGIALRIQFIRSLLHKKMVYTKNNLSVIIVMMILISIALLSISLILKERNIFKPTNRLVNLNLNLYNNPITYYKSYDPIFGQKYKLISENFTSKATEAVESNLNDVLINYAKNDLIFYDNHLIAAAEFNKTGKNLILNALYSEKATYSFPISINLLSNTIIKSFLDDDYSISLSSQNLPSLNALIYTDNTTINAFTTAVIFVFLFYPAIALFVVHPLRESLTNIKQLQRMAGVSGFIYWGTLFLFDFIVFLFLIALTIMGFISMDFFLDLQMYEQTEILILLLLFVLFAINSLLFVYIFTFINTLTSSVIRLLTYIPMSLVLMELIMCAVKAQLDDYEVVKILRPIQKKIFLLIPYLSFFHSQISFYTTAQQNSRCKKMPNQFYNTMCNTLNPNSDICCEMECYNGECKNYLKYFTNFEKEITLEESIMYLSVTPILYIGILLLLEFRIIQKLRIKMSKPISFEYEIEEQVKREKLSIANKLSELKKYSLSNTHLKTYNYNIEIFPKNSSNLNSNNQLFFVHELRKQYGNLLAVKDVSFGVNEHECFGLLGVNGAGKSTTFRMMTGQDVPNSGVMYIGNNSINVNRSVFLSQMGYCPQTYALISSINAFDHLRLFANLRGIPHCNVEEEVTTWIQRLNLNACALKPSGTYSGGNKRRLNIAMALIGNPNLVLLDEPTTGVDPAARRSLWNVIQSCQTIGQAVVLTSHSMEECEALCNRLAIMVGGRFACIGPCQELKQRFGAGYDIQMKLNPDKAKNQINDIKQYITNCELDIELADENLGYLLYHVTTTNTSWRKMHDIMNIAKIKYDCIDDFSVVSSTLEQLFLLFARAVDKDVNHEIKRID